MGKDRIDASVGLEFSLKLFNRYRSNGILEAEIRQMPGFRGHCKGYLHLVEGKVVTCYLEDKQGQRYSVAKEELIRLDNKKGPFEWSLLPLPAPPTTVPRNTGISQHATLDSPIAQRIANLELERLEGWSDEQKMMLLTVFDAIDGIRSIESLKLAISLPPAIVEEALRVLLALKVISISS